MVRSFTAFIMVVSAGGTCLDKPSSECVNVIEQVCAQRTSCEWVGGTCLDKPSSECVNVPEQFCAQRTDCVWFGGSSVAGDDQEGEGEDEGGDDQEGEDEGGDDCVDVDGYGDHLGNVCAHYANNIQNCKHSDASKPGTDGKTPCEACCACGGCPAPTCAAHDCPEGHDALSGEISCGQYGDACTDDDCCKAIVTCGGAHTCPQGRQAKATDTVCTEGTCTDDICCDAPVTCGGDYTCPEGRQAKAIDTMCTEGTCTDDICCDAPVTCGADYACDDGWHHKDSATVCQGGSCTADLCCEVIPINCETCMFDCHGQDEHKEEPLMCGRLDVKKPNPEKIICVGGKCSYEDCCERDDDSSSDGACVTAISASAVATISAAMAIFN